MMNSSTQRPQTGTTPVGLNLNPSTVSSVNCGVSLANMINNNSSGATMLPSQQPQQQQQQMQNLMYGPVAATNMNNNNSNNHMGAFAPPSGGFTFGTVQPPQQQQFVISQQPSMVVRGGFPGSPPLPMTYAPSAFVPTGEGGGGSSVFSTPGSPPVQLRIAIPASTPSNNFNMSALQHNLGSPMSPDGAGIPRWNSPPQPPGYFPSQVPSLGFANFSLATSPRHQQMPYTPPNQAFMRTGQSNGNNMMTPTTSGTMMMNNPPFSTGLMTSNNQQQQGTSTSPRPSLMFPSVAESFQQQQQQQQHQLHSAPSLSSSASSSTITPSNSLPPSPRIPTNHHQMTQLNNLVTEERAKMSISPQLKRKTSSPAMGTCSRCGNSRSNQESPSCTCVEGSSPKLHHLDRKSLPRVSDKIQQSKSQPNRLRSSTNVSISSSSSHSESDVEVVIDQALEEQEEGPDKKTRQNPSHQQQRIGNVVNNPSINNIMSSSTATTTSKGFCRRLNRELSDVEEEHHEREPMEQEHEKHNEAQINKDRPSRAQQQSQSNPGQHHPLRVQQTIAKGDGEADNVYEDQEELDVDNDDDDEDYQDDEDDDDNSDEDFDELNEEEEEVEDGDDDDEEYQVGDEHRRPSRTNSGGDGRRRINATSKKHPIHRRRASTSSLPRIQHFQREFITPTTTNRLSNMSTSTIPLLKSREASYGEDPYMDQLSPASLSRKESSSSLANQFMRWNNVSSPVNATTPTTTGRKRAQRELIMPVSKSSTGNTHNNHNPSNIVGRRGGRGHQQQRQQHDSNNVESDDAAGDGATFNGGGGGLGGERRLTIAFISLGTQCSFGKCVQTYGKNGWIIPHNLSGTHKMYSQEWKFLVTHEMCMDTVVVRWTVTNLASGSVTSVAETPRQAIIRQTKGNTICNVVLQKAMSHRAKELETQAAVPGITENKRRNLQSLAKELRPKKCTEGLLFFGLRHMAVQLPDATTRGSSSSAASTAVRDDITVTTTTMTGPHATPAVVQTVMSLSTSSAEASNGSPAASGGTAVAEVHTTETVLSDAANLGSEYSPTATSSSSPSPLLDPPCPSIVPTTSGT